MKRAIQLILFSTGLALPTGSGCSPADGRGNDLVTTVARNENELFLGGFFPVGVFSQPSTSFEKWKSRGINTILEVPQNHDALEWDSAAKRAGLKIIRRPLSDPKADIGRKDLLAWSQWDEPDAAGRIAE
jgi:hypothetical protein